MRVVGGTLRGGTIHAPNTSLTRPTSDRVRESVFNILAHGIEGADLAGVKVIDLFAGSGALGIEALSRGAAHCLFVESDAEARGTLQHNIEAFHLQGVSKVFRRDATSLGPAGGKGGAGIVFLDPPYGQGLGERALVSLRDGGWLEPGAIAILEERASSEVAVPDSFELIDQRRWGDTSVMFLRFMRDEPDARGTKA